MKVQNPIGNFKRQPFQAKMGEKFRYWSFSYQPAVPYIK